MKAGVMAPMGTLGSCCDVQLQVCPFPSERCRVARESGEAGFARPVPLVCPYGLFSALGKFRGSSSGWDHPGCVAPVPRSPAPGTVLPGMLPSPATRRCQGPKNRSPQGFHWPQDSLLPLPDPSPPRTKGPAQSCPSCSGRVTALLCC